MMCTDKPTLQKKKKHFPRDHMDFTWKLFQNHMLKYVWPHVFFFFCNRLFIFCSHYFSPALKGTSTEPLLMVPSLTDHANNEGHDWTPCRAIKAFWEWAAHLSSSYTQMDKANGPVMAGYQIKPVTTLTSVLRPNSGEVISLGWWGGKGVI